MGDDHFICRNECEPARLEVALLGQREQIPEEFLVALQHFLELHHPAVGFVQLPVEAVGARIGFRAVFGNGRKVDAAGKISDILRLRIRRTEGPDADALFFRQDNPHDFDLFNIAAVFIFQPHLAGRAQIALNAYPEFPFNLRAQLQRNQVQRVFMHRAAFNRINRPCIRSRILLQTAFQQSNKCRFTAADRSHEQQYPFADVETAGGGMEILLHQLFHRTVQPKNFLFKKLIPLASVDVFYAV
ncbi:hypothetical protein D3C75_724650 [compost metagenome]